MIFFCFFSILGKKKKIRFVIILWCLYKQYQTALLGVFKPCRKKTVWPLGQENTKQVFKHSGKPCLNHVLQVLFQYAGHMEGT